MARCGHCGAQNIPTVQSTPDNEGAGLAPHSPPFLPSGKCKGQETYYRRPQAPTTSTGPTGSAAFLRDNKITSVRNKGRDHELTDEDTFTQQGEPVSSSSSLPKKRTNNRKAS